MSETVTCDARGRVSLGKEVPEHLGRSFHVVRLPDEVVLIPVSKNPLRSLKEQGKKIPAHLTIDELKRQARAELEKEALGNLERVKRLAKGRKKRGR